MRFVIFCLAVACSAPACADVFKCQTPSGEIVFSDTACDQGASFEKTRQSESVSDPDAARRELERQRVVAERQAAENEAARRTPATAASLPDTGSPPPAWPAPTPLSPSSSVVR